MSLMGYTEEQVAEMYESCLHAIKYLNNAERTRDGVAMTAEFILGLLEEGRI